jgi:hypothetical protein
MQARRSLLDTLPPPASDAKLFRRVFIALVTSLAGMMPLLCVKA